MTGIIEVEENLTEFELGKIGDHLVRVIVVPKTTSSGTVTIHCGNEEAIVLYMGSNVHGAAPVTYDINKKCHDVWKITTGANVKVLAILQH